MTEEVIQQAEQLNSLTGSQNKFAENNFAIRDTISEKISK